MNSQAILKLCYNQKSPKNGLREVRTPYCTQINNTRVGFIYNVHYKYIPTFPLVNKTTHILLCVDSCIVWLGDYCLVSYGSVFTVVWFGLDTCLLW